MAPPSARLKTRHALGALFVAVFGAYFNALGNGLVDFDDAVVLHPAGAFGPAAAERLASDLGGGDLSALPRALAARPLTGLSHALDGALGGGVWLRHLSNVVHHFAAACVAYLAAAALLGSAPAGLAAALLFALHPVQTESVAYLAGRRDVLSGLLALASLWAWLRGRAGAAFALWLLALTAKPSAVTLPLLWLAAPAAAGAPARRVSGRLVAACAAAMAAVVLAHLWVEAAQARRHALAPELLWYGGGPLSQWATEPRIVLHALKRLLWPLELSADHSLQVFPPSASFLEAGSLLGLAAVAALAGLAWSLRRRRPHAAFALLWLMLSYAPMLHLLPSTHNQEPFAEHWLYLPVFGLALLAGALLRDARSPRAAWACLAAVLALCAARTAARNRDWKDAETLWSRAVETYPLCGRAHGILGRARLERGELAAAEASLERAVELRPDDPKHRLNLARLRRVTGAPREAERLLLEARALPAARLLEEDLGLELELARLASGAPPSAPGSRAMGFEPRPRGGTRALQLGGAAAASRGDVRAAESAFVRALALNPGSAGGYQRLGALHMARGEYALAASLFEKALARQPGRLDARVGLGAAYVRAGLPARGRAALEQAVASEPRSVEAWLALSDALLLGRDLAKALAAAKQAARLEKSPRTDRQLFAVYREL